MQTTRLLEMDVDIVELGCRVNTECIMLME